MYLSVGYLLDSSSYAETYRFFKFGSVSIRVVLGETFSSVRIVEGTNGLDCCILGVLLTFFLIFLRA